jgi:hypothetical protein
MQLEAKSCEPIRLVREILESFDGMKRKLRLPGGHSELKRLTNALRGS